MVTGVIVDGELRGRMWCAVEGVTMMICGGFDRPHEAGCVSGNWCWSEVWGGAETCLFGVGVEAGVVRCVVVPTC